jgi:fructose-bisphosphate aldolase, class II
MGPSHGAYKFTRRPDGDILSMRVVEAIHAKLPNIHLVMHGSSSVPQELQDRFNAYGGAIRQTYGVPVEEIVRGIKHGVRKVNIDTDCHLAMTAELRRVAQESPGEFDPRKFLKPATEAMREVCRSGSSNLAPPEMPKKSKFCRCPRWSSAMPRAASILP